MFSTPNASSLRWSSRASSPRRLSRSSSSCSTRHLAVGGSVMTLCRRSRNRSRPSRLRFGGCRTIDPRSSSVCRHIADPSRHVRLLLATPAIRLDSQALTAARGTEKCRVEFISDGRISASERPDRTLLFGVARRHRIGSSKWHPTARPGAPCREQLSLFLCQFRLPKEHTGHTAARPR
jgi:hypothetical protein